MSVGMFATGRLGDLRIVDPYLSELARGYSNADLVGTYLLPVVQVQKESGKVPIFTKEAFKSYNTKRGLRADSNIMNPENTTTTSFTLDENDISYPMDVRELSDAAYALDEHATFTVSEILALALENEIATLVQTDSNYPTGSKVTLTGNDQWTSTNAASQPIDDIETAKDAIRSKIGKDPNTIVFGAAAWRTFKNHSTVIDRIKYTGGSVGTVPVITSMAAASLLEIPNVYIGKAINRSDADVASDVWSDNVILAYVDPGIPNIAGENGVIRNFDRPSFGYTLKKMGYPIIDEWRKSGDKTILIRNTDIYLPKVLGYDAGYIIKDTNA